MKKLLIIFAIFVALVSGACGKETEQKKVQVEKAGKVANLATKSLLPSLYVGKIRPLRCLPNSLILVQFNACNFGRSKSDAELVFMAKMFCTTDLIAIEEISTSNFGAQAVAKLSDELNRTGGKWDYAVSDSTHESNGRERYAFLWRSDRIEAFPHKPILVKQFAGDLEREPAKMTFRIAGKIFEVFSFHLVPTNKNPLNEVEVLGVNPEIFSGQNCFLVGDFNLGNKELNQVFERQLNFQHQIEGKTSLKKKNSKGNYRKSEYDNIYLRGNFQLCQAGILDFVPLCPSLKEARKISDHLPVFVEFVLN